MLSSTSLNIYVQNIENIDFLVSFLMINDTIETLSVNFITEENFCKENFQNFQKENNVSFFKLSGNVGTINMIHEKLQTFDSASFKSFELSYYNHELQGMVKRILIFPRTS